MDSLFSILKSQQVFNYFATNENDLSGVFYASNQPDLQLLSPAVTRNAIFVHNDFQIKQTRQQITDILFANWTNCKCSRQPNLWRRSEDFNFQLEKMFTLKSQRDFILIICSVKISHLNFTLILCVLRTILINLIDMPKKAKTKTSTKVRFSNEQNHSAQANNLIPHHISKIKLKHPINSALNNFAELYADTFNFSLSKKLQAR